MRAVVITGVSSGIGRATAEHLIANGFHVFGGTGPMLEPTAVVRLSLFSRPRWKSLMSTSSMKRPVSSSIAGRSSRNRG